MSASLIGINGTTIATDANPIPVQLTSTSANTITFNDDDAITDSFGRLRVSEPRIAFEYSFGAQTPTLATTIWESTAYGAGTEALTTNLYGVNLTTTVATGTGRWIQSYNHVRYAPGISTLLRFTFNMISPNSANLRQRVGMFTDQGTFPSTAGDGLYLENDSGTISVVRRYMTQGATGTEERVLQADWNQDKLNGTGASGVTLNFTKAQHLVIEFQWLGVGTIRFGFETAAGLIWCHKMISVNALAESWSRTGTLPVRAECYNYGASVINNLTLINCVVLQEGDVSDMRGWKYFGGTSGATAKVGGTAAGLYPVLGIKAATTNDLTKRARILPHMVTIVVAVASTGATSLQCALLMNGTPATGATFAVTVAGATTVVDNAATAATAITGTAIWNAVIPNVVGQYTFDLSTLNDNMNAIGYNAAGTAAITGPANLYLCVGTLTGTATVAATVAASINWKEIV
jgi:hypothetical protein